MNRSGSQSGFTLIEIMVAVTLGLFVMAGMIGIFVGTSRGYREDQKLATVSDELALAMAQMTEDVEMAGFWGHALDPTEVRVDSIGGRQYWAAIAPGGTPSLDFSGAHCGPQPSLSPTQVTAGESNNNVWTYDASLWASHPLFAENNLADASPTNFPCITDAVPGTDVIGLMRVNGGPSREVDSAGVVTGALTDNRVYLRSNNKLGALWKYNAAAAAAPPAAFFTPTNDFKDWEYRISVYYVRDHSVTAGDGIPTLCRKYLSYGAATPAIATECFAQGIENLQVEYGIDDDAGAVPDGTPDRWLSDPDAIEIQRVAAIRIWLLARSVNLDNTAGARDTLLGNEAGYSNAKTYTLAGGTAAGGATVTASDSFYRKLATSLVVIRNASHLRAIGSD